MTSILFFQLLVNGLALGLLYVLVVLGLDIILRVTRIVNFAHGQIYMIGAYVFFYTNVVVHLNFALGLIISGIVMFLIGGICYILIFNRVQSQLKGSGQFMYRLIMSAMASLGLMMILSQGALLVFGTTMKSIPAIFSSLSIGKVSLPGEKVAIIAVGLILLICLYFVMFKTKLGKSMRAVSLDDEVSALYGINTFRIYLLGFAIGCGLAGIAGAMIAPVYSVSANMGADIIFIALTVMIVGGIGSYKGTILGGLAIGLLTSYGIFFIGGLYQLFLFAAALILIGFRPGGFFGEAVD